MDDHFNNFVVLHTPQLLANSIPEILWPALHQKLSNETFDICNVTELHFEDKFVLSVSNEEGIKKDNPTAIYLIDHAWTFLMENARKQLEEHPELLNRIAAITGVETTDKNCLQNVMRQMWRYLDSYVIEIPSGPEGEKRKTVWYLLDEIGCAIAHSDMPNFKLVPFIHLDTQIAYSVLFPLEDCSKGEMITTDFFAKVKDSKDRKALQLVRQDICLREHSFVQVEPAEDYFTRGHILETYISPDALPPVERNNKRPLKVYSEYSVLNQYLTSTNFILVDSETDAEVLWLAQHFKDYAKLSIHTPSKFINQFPFEYVITNKDLLSIVCRRASPEHHNASTLETYPHWLPTTYNLMTERLEFISYFQNREAAKLDNHWIIKPFNLARGIDMYITDNIQQIMRLAFVSPKIAQKYIERPVLYKRNDINADVKFDIRYVILLKSVKPLQAYIYKKFFLRFANKAFTLDDLEDYEKHYTVMNYHENAKLHHIKCDDFLISWHEQYPNHSWESIEQDICSMLRQTLISASYGPPPCSLAACQQSRALYAADIMLEWNEKRTDMQAKLLEINYAPDCERACEYYNDFYNDVFELLFLDEENNDKFRRFD